MNKTYYQKLGLKESAAAEEIKKAYKKLANKHHPDKNGGDEQCKIIFQEINAIYEILSDPISKREYDLALKIKREWIKKSNIKREQYLRKRRYERNYFQRPIPRPEYFKDSAFFRTLYYNIGPIFLFFIIFFVIGMVNNAFDKPKNPSINKAVNFDSIVYINSSLAGIPQGFFLNDDAKR